MLRAISFLLLLSMAPFVRAAATASPTPVRLAPRTDETQVWDLEKAYWEYVKANDLQKYRDLWHERFLGWPYVSAAPVGKDRITDWITANTSQGLKLRSYSIDQLGIRVTSDIAINHYRIKAIWAKGDKAEVVRTDGLRITHTWLRTHGTWQIIGGMSAPVNADGK
jgi:hypothetical protein